MISVLIFKFRRIQFYGLGKQRLVYGASGQIGANLVVDLGMNFYMAETISSVTLSIGWSALIKTQLSPRSFL